MMFFFHSSALLRRRWYVPYVVVRIVRCDDKPNSLSREEKERGARGDVKKDFEKI
jgi:hypothetical protein